VEKILARGPTPESQVQVWEEVLAHELNHHSCGFLHGQVACDGDAYPGPRPLASEDDRRWQDQFRKTDDVESNALLLMRATGIRIGECLNLATGTAEV
jgi:hypothetical protein